jgi:MerR family transcriptional regulator, light-induced transcriptional regulator
MMDPFHAEAAGALDAQRAAVAEAAVARQYDYQPELAERYGPAGRARCLHDAGYHLAYLSEAVAAASPALFADYVRWAAVMLASRGIPVPDLAANLGHLRMAVVQHVPSSLASLATTYVDSGLAALADPPASLPSLLVTDAPLAELAQHYLASLLRYDRQTATRLIMDAVASGMAIADLYLHVFQRVQREVGRLWQLNEVTVAQEHYCTAATQVIMAQLYPHIFRGERRHRRFVGTCVAGDLHELGMRMVSDVMELHGWDSVYLGANMPTPAIIQTLRAQQVEVLAISATMPFHARAVAELISAVRLALPERRPTILVGGYAFLQQPDLWRQVGADGHAADAAAAVACAAELINDGASS